MCTEADQRAAVDAEALVRCFYDQVWNAADEAMAFAILAPDFRFCGSLGSELSGPAGFVDYLRMVHAALADYRCDIEDLVVAGARVAARMAFHGRHRGPFLGVAPTGRVIRWAGAAFFATAGGRITEVWVLGDVDSIRQQLGQRA